MAITPAIEQMTFAEAKKHGYSTEEVDAFLDQLASEVDSMLQEIADLKGRLNYSEQQLAAAQAQVASREEHPVVAPAPAPVASESLAASERQISQVLIVAQQSADKLLADARDNADRIRNEADAKAREVIRQALAEKQNELDEIDRLKASREEFRGEYKKLLQHFMDDAEAVFPMQGSLPSAPNGSAGTVASDVPVSAPAPVASPIPAPAPAASAADFGDLD